MRRSYKSVMGDIRGDYDINCKVAIDLAKNGQEGACGIALDKAEECLIIMGHFGCDPIKYINFISFSDAVRGICYKVNREKQ